MTSTTRPNWENLVSTGSSLAYIWNNTHSNPSVRADTKYKIRGGRITGENRKELQEEVIKAIQNQKLVLLIAGGNDLFDRKTKTFRLYEQITVSEWGMERTRLRGIYEDFCDFYRKCVDCATTHQCTLIILSIFPRYFVGNREIGYTLIHESLFRKTNKKLGNFIDTLVLEKYERTNKWVRIRFLDLSSYFLENVEILFKNPKNDPHLSNSGKHLLVAKIKQLIHLEYEREFVPMGDRAESILPEWDHSKGPDQIGIDQIE